ncbi:MAG: proprotein convertase P-domain-containing protein [Anaerolineae bacterium]
MRKVAVLLLVVMMLADSVIMGNPVQADPQVNTPSVEVKEGIDSSENDLLVLPVGGALGVTAQAGVNASSQYLINGQALSRETEPNDTIGQANPLGSDNTVIIANIYPNADIDYFSFPANAGDRIYAATMTSFSASGSTDSQLEIVNAGGVRLEYDDDDGSFGGLSSSIAGAMITTTGMYYIKVSHFLTAIQLRPYYLHFRKQSGSPTPEVELNNDTTTATPLPLNGWVAGVISATGDVDFYSLPLNAGDTVFLSLDLDPERDGVTWNGRVGLGIFNNFILVANDGSVTSPNSEAEFITVKEAGVYYVYVDHATNAGVSSSTYHLSVSVHPAEVHAGNCTTYTSNTTVPIVDAGVVTTTITVPGHPRISDLDVTLNLSHTNMPDLDVTLRSPGGSEVALFTDIGASTQVSMSLVLDDQAGLPLGSFTILYGLRYQPKYSTRLGWFDHQDAGGVWTLSLYDDLATNAGSLTSWSLTVCEPPPVSTCPFGYAPVVLYASDFETDDGGFTHSSVVTVTADEWERGLPSYAPITNCNSGSNCWKTDLDNTYNAFSNQDLLSPVIALTDPNLVGPVRVSWAQKYQMETATFDHAYVQVQLAGGGSALKLWEWMDATMQVIVGNPPVTIQESAGWGTYSRDISSYLGQTVELLFHLDADDEVQLTGLAVDDVMVTACRCNNLYLPLVKK